MLSLATAAFAIGQGIASWAWQAPPPQNGDADWPRVRISDPLVKTVVRHGLAEASRLLEQPRCRAILTEFHDQHDRPLADKLTALGVDVSRYLRLVVVLDGSQNQRCGDTQAFTAPGSRVVYVCGRPVLQIWRESSGRLVVALIHEVLHTLGLGENPPSSEEITEKVRLRCGSS
jgi:hypothetical protein